MPQARDFREITPREIKFCYSYLSNGGNGYKAAIDVGHSQASARGNSHKYLKSPAVKRFMSKQLQKIEDELGADFMWKIQKLKRAIELCMPDYEENHKNCNMTALISAINEMNRMQGHHAAEKRVIENKDKGDIEAVHEILDELKEKYKKDY